MSSDAASSIEELDPMQERIDDVLAAHGGDVRSAIEMLLLYGDGVMDSLSFGYLRGRIVTRARLSRSEGKVP